MYNNDLAKPFSLIGHDHIRRTLESLLFSNNLYYLVIYLVTLISTKISVNKKITSCISLHRDIAQCSFLLPIISNLCQDFPLNLIFDIEMANVYCFEFSPSLNKL